jgi:glutathione S-transferase
MYTLYYKPGACSMAVHVVLNEIGAPYKLELGSVDGKPTEKFLKANPRGAVPVLEDDGFVLREGAAILMYLIDKHQSPLLPREGKERAHALEWLMSVNATLHPAYGRLFFLNAQLGDKAKDSPLVQAVFGQINKLWAEIDRQLASSDYIAGKQITAADILMTVIANWSARFGGAITLGPNLKRVLKNVVARPSYQKALAEEQIEYKVAA